MQKMKNSSTTTNFEYLGKTKNDKKKTFKTLPIEMDKMKIERVDKKTIKLIKK
jgi:hypothetical protein